jgi:hypothetical protein
MENLSKVFAGATQAAGPLDCVTQLPEDWRLARAAHVDLLLMGLPRVNVLLIGMDRVIWSLLEALRPDLREPVVSWYPGRRFALPATGASGTMVLQDVGGLTPEDQMRLFDWLERNGGKTQVISTSSTPLLPRVQAGTFIDMLYYRLNTVCVDILA